MHDGTKFLPHQTMNFSVEIWHAVTHLRSTLLEYGMRLAQLPSPAVKFEIRIPLALETKIFCQIDWLRILNDYDIFL